MSLTRVLWFWHSLQSATARDPKPDQIRRGLLTYLVIGIEWNLTLIFSNKSSIDHDVRRLSLFHADFFCRKSFGWGRHSSVRSQRLQIDTKPRFGIASPGLPTMIAGAADRFYGWIKYLLKRSIIEWEYFQVSEIADFRYGSRLKYC